MCEGYLIGEHVLLQVWDREEGFAEDIGGGINSGNPKSVVTLSYTGSDWVVYQWEHSGQIVIVPACDVLCISGDLPRQESVSEKEAEVPSEGDWVLLADALDKALGALWGDLRTEG